MLRKIKRLELILDEKSGKILAVLLLSALLCAACGGRPILSEEGEPAEQQQEKEQDLDPPPMCYVDFPCGSEETMHCISATQYIEVGTVSCEQICGDMPCSGGACVEVGELKDCPAGTTCVTQDEGGWGARNDSCQVVEPPPMCFVDFPCGPEESMHCINETQYVEVRTVSCEEICGDVPCSGGACEELDEIMQCPEGHVCVTTTDQSPWERDDHCAPME